MKLGVVRPNMLLRRQRMKLSHEVVHNLKEISKVSSFKRWEYAGGIEYDNLKFSTPTRITSKNETESKLVKLNRCGILKYHIIHIQGLGIMNGLYAKIHQYIQPSLVMQILKHISRGFLECR